MLGFIVNIPSYSVLGLFAGSISGPEKIVWRRYPYAIIVNVKNLWWAIGFMKGARAIKTAGFLLHGDRPIKSDFRECGQFRVEKWRRATI